MMADFMAFINLVETLSNPKLVFGANLLLFPTVSYVLEFECICMSFSQKISKRFVFWC